MPGFKALKDKLTILLGANAAGDFILKPVLFTVVKILGPFRINTKSTLPVLYKGNNKAWMIAHLFTTWSAKCFQPILESGSGGRWGEITLKILLFTDSAHGHLRPLMKMCNEINAVFKTANTTSILQPMDQGLILVFKSYDLRNTFHMAMAPTGSDFSDETGKNKLKTFLERNHNSGCHYEHS